MRCEQDSAPFAAHFPCCLKNHDQLSLPYAPQPASRECQLAAPSFSDEEASRVNPKARKK